MSKRLDEIIEEMGNYSDMGMPDGQGAMGMGTAAPMGGLRGGSSDGRPKLKAYKLNDVLRSRNRAEEEEGLDGIDTDMEDTGMDDMGMEDEGGTAELKQFFTDNPEPSDDEISAYAEEHDMDLQEMRLAVYRLIQSLLPSDEEDMGDEDSMDFSVSGDTGERPASNELDMGSQRSSRDRM